MANEHIKDQPIHVVCPRCIYCGEQSTVTMSTAEFAKLTTGEYVQNIFPHWSAGQRELLITGTHPKCWDELMKDITDDDDEEI